MDYVVSSILSGLGNAKPGIVRDPFIGLGNHRLAVIGLSIKPTQKFGPSIFVDFEVLETDNPAAHQPGTKVTIQFRVSMQSARGFEQAAEYSRLLAFLTAMTGHQISDNAAAQAAAQSFILQGTARGFVVKARGYHAKAGAKFVDIEWKHQEGQTEQTIAQVRAHLDAKYPVNAAPAPAPAQPPQPTQPYQMPGAPVGGYQYPPATPPAQAPYTPPAAPPMTNAPAPQPAAGGFNLGALFGQR